jgi:hypothetical protein
MVSSFTFRLFLSSAGTTDQFGQRAIEEIESTFLRVFSTIIDGWDPQDYVEQRRPVEDQSKTSRRHTACTLPVMCSLFHHWREKEVAEKVQGKSTATEACLRRDASLQALRYTYFKLTSRSGLGQNLLQVVFGRLISGVGGAGINCLVSIVIAGITKATTLLFKANRVSSQIYCQ